MPSVAASASMCRTIQSVMVNARARGSALSLSALRASQMRSSIARSPAEMRTLTWPVAVRFGGGWGLLMEGGLAHTS